MKLQLPFLKGKGSSKKSGGIKEHYRIVSLDKKKARVGWFFVLPFILGFILIYIPIIWESLKYSFSRINFLSSGGIIAENVMFDNYKEALGRKEFVDTVLGGMKQLGLETLAIMFFSLFIAIILNQKMVGRAAFRAIFFVPVILATGLISGIDASTGQAAQTANTIAT
ncbi:MAG: sugar ABC transporter permease, partial [Clostridia bacterium]|nr:sugar ABC transporter permease [Clostridia bacterium]